MSSALKIRLYFQEIHRIRRFHYSRILLNTSFLAISDGLFSFLERDKQTINSFAK